MWFMDSRRSWPNITADIAQERRDCWVTKWFLKFCCIFVGGGVLVWLWVCWVLFWFCGVSLVFCSFGCEVGVFGFSILVGLG